MHELTLQNVQQQYVSECVQKEEQQSTSAKMIPYEWIKFVQKQSRWSKPRKKTNSKFHTREYAVRNGIHENEKKKKQLSSSWP